MYSTKKYKAKVDFAGIEKGQTLEKVAIEYEKELIEKGFIEEVGQSKKEAKKEA